MKASFIIFATTVLAAPTLNKRYYDLDHNGIPDMCFYNGDVVDCLLSESAGLSWTTFTASSTAAPTSTSTSTPTSVSVSTTAAPTSTSTSLLVQVAASTTAPATTYPTGTLPLDPDTFQADNGTKWTVEHVGHIYSSSDPLLGWDNGRTSVLSDTPFWNFGDVLSLDGTMDDGFSTGPAFFGNKDNILEVDMGIIDSVANLLLAPPDSADAVPEEPTPFWGLSTSNVAEVSPGVGVGFVWEVWRDTTGTRVDKGLGIFRTELGDTMPYGNRTGPLVTGPDALQVGIMTVAAFEGYVYTYANAGVTGIVVGRALLADAFDADSYEFLKTDGTWVTGIPSLADANAEYGCEGEVNSAGQGSVMYSNYFNQYMLFTGAYASSINFYTSDTPYGPWTGLYNIETIPGYGVNVHPWWSPDGSHKELYVSSGTDNIIQMYKVTFDY